MQKSTKQEQNRILIADDDPSNRRVLQGYLSKIGICDFVANGPECLAALERAWDEGNPYSLICLDIHMPILSGMQVLQLLREREEERGILGLDGVKVIMITSDDLPKTILKAFRNGCEAYHVKPVRAEKLFLELKRLGIHTESEQKMS